MRWKRSKKTIRMWSRNASAKHLELPNNASPIVLSNRDFILASTKESITLPDDVAGLICTLSHVSRFGLTATAGSLLIRPGYGTSVPKPLTLEIASLNPSPLEFPIGIPICHLAFVRLSHAVGSQSKSIYENHDIPCPPMLYEDMIGKIGELKYDGGPL